MMLAGSQGSSQGSVAGKGVSKKDSAIVLEIPPPIFFVSPTKGPVLSCPLSHISYIHPQRNRQHTCTCTHHMHTHTHTHTYSLQYTLFYIHVSAQTFQHISFLTLTQSSTLPFPTNLSPSFLPPSPPPSPSLTGEIMPGQTVTIYTTFLPAESGSFSKQMNIFVAEQADPTRPYLSFFCRGVGMYPRLTFSKQQVDMPTVPLGNFRFTPSFHCSSPLCLSFPTLIPTPLLPPLFPLILLSSFH